MDLEEIKQNKNNKEYMLNAVKEKGKILEYATEELKDDKELVLEALKQDGEALEFASEKLKADKEIILLAIQSAPWTICYASEKLKNDKEIILKCVEDYGQALYFASEKLRNDEEIVKKAVANKGIIIKYASDRILHNKEIAKIAINQDKRAFDFLPKELREEIENGTYYFEDTVRVETLPGSLRFYRQGEGRLIQTPTETRLECTCYGEPYTLIRSAKSMDSMHIEYDYLKRGDCIDISVPDDSFWCYVSKRDVITKIAFATEEMYKFAHKK